MMLGLEQLGFALRLAAVVLPVAAYFLVLGLLNSRRRPQLLSGRQDFILLTATLSPLFISPIVMALGLPLLHVLLATAVVCGAAYLLMPRRPCWVIYNLSAEQTRQLVARCLSGAGLEARPVGQNLRLPDGGTLRISGFTLLRNVTIRLDQAKPSTARQLEQSLTESLARCRAETSPMAVTLLLVATGMLMAPLALVVQQMPTIVRLLTDLTH